MNRNNFTSILFVEQGTYWRGLAVRLLGTQSGIDSWDPGKAAAPEKLEYRFAAVELVPEVMDAWLSLFDKSPSTIENPCWAALGVQPGGKIALQLQELGFSGFVPHVDALNELLGGWQEQLSVDATPEGFAAIWRSRVPWQQSSN
ncbi:MAG: hypothetical protein VX768_19835 [Planctomycetota bacterium]|nr:hypothetical protein [Planctomycetota bacterium]